MTQPPPRHLRQVVPVAIGNHRDGYRGVIEVQYAEGPAWYPLSACDHRHLFTRTARRCAQRRWTAFLLARRERDAPQPCPGCGWPAPDHALDCPLT